MAKATQKIRFKTKLLRPASPQGAAWTFLVLPASASAKLPTRSMVTVDGTLEGQPFQDRKSTRLNSSHVKISYAVFCLKKKKRRKCIRTLGLPSHAHAI